MKKTDVKKTERSKEFLAEEWLDRESNHGKSNYGKSNHEKSVQGGRGTAGSDRKNWTVKETDMGKDCAIKQN